MMVSTPPRAGKNAISILSIAQIPRRIKSFFGICPPDESPSGPDFALAPLPRGGCHDSVVTGGVYAFSFPTPVSPAGSGPAPRWGASRTDRSGNGDRFAPERHWRSRSPPPPTHKTLCEEGTCAGAGGGRLFYISHSKGGLSPPLEPLYGRPRLSIALGGVRGGRSPAS